MSESTSLELNAKTQVNKERKWCAMIKKIVTAYLTQKTQSGRHKTTNKIMHNEHSEKKLKQENKKIKS